MRIMRSMTNGKEYARNFARRARAVGMSVNELCRRAKVAPSTFQRMRTGQVEPSLGTINKLLAVLERAERAKAKLDEEQDEAPEEVAA